MNINAISVLYCVVISVVCCMYFICGVLNVIDILCIPEIRSTHVDDVVILLRFIIMVLCFVLAYCCVLIYCFDIS